MAGRFLIYGATGYTGRLTARTARRFHLKPVLASRNGARVKAIADAHGFNWCTFTLDQKDAMDKALQDVDLVLNMAGPFAATAEPMLEACLRTGTHYLDITGEYEVMEMLAARSSEAKEAGIMVMPGVGFDTVPTDCLALHLKQRLPSATTLTLGIGGMSTPSRGTAKTMIEHLGRGVAVRRDGVIMELTDLPRHILDFGDGPTSCVGVSWGDISSAYHSTAIQNIHVYFVSTPEIEQAVDLSPMRKFLIKLPFMKKRLKRQIDQRPEGPSDEQRAEGFTRIVGIVEDAAGNKAVARMRTPDGYSLTVSTSLEIAVRALDGVVKPGFQTPATVFGPDFILAFNGVTREDVR